MRYFFGDAEKIKLQSQLEISNFSNRMMAVVVLVLVAFLPSVASHSGGRKRHVESDLEVVVSHGGAAFGHGRV